MELGLISRTGNVVAGVRIRSEEYSDSTWKSIIKREGKGGAALYDSPSPRW